MPCSVNRNKSAPIFPTSHHPCVRPAWILFTPVALLKLKLTGPRFQDKTTSQIFDSVSRALKELPSDRYYQREDVPESHGGSMRKHSASYISFAILCVFIASGCSESINHTQPILYNHKKHIDDAGLNCFDCHTRCFPMKKLDPDTSGFAREDSRTTDDGEQKRRKNWWTISGKINPSHGYRFIGCRSRLFFPPATCVDPEKSPVSRVTGRGRDDAPVFQTVSSHQDGVLHRLPCEKPREHGLRDMSSVGSGSKK